MFKIAAATVVFLVSDDALKLTFAGAISVLAVYGILPPLEHFLYPPSVECTREHLPVLIQDALTVVRVTNHLLNNLLLLSAILLANVIFHLRLLFQCLCCCMKWICCPQEHATNQVAIEYVPDPEAYPSGVVDILNTGPEANPAVTDEWDNDAVAGDKDDDNYDDDGNDDDFDESTGLLSQLKGFSAFGSVELSPLPPLPPLPIPITANHLQELLSYEMNRKNNLFCYMRCLDPVDRALFQAKMIELILENCKDRSQQIAIITQGCMKMRTWRRIMKQIQTVNTYKLWRNAYWGENAGRKMIHKIHSIFHVLVDSFEGQSGSRTVNLLHTNGHIEVRPSLLISPSAWSNEQASQQVWDDQSD